MFHSLLDFLTCNSSKLLFIQITSWSTYFFKKFSSVIDPLSKNKQSVDDFLASLSDVGTTTQTYTAPTLSQRRSSKVMSNVMMQTMNSYEPTSSYDNNNNTQTSAPSDDLYVYTYLTIALQKSNF